jgi:hypothetical protein
MPSRVDPAVNDPQPADLDAMLDRAGGQPRIEEKGARHEPVALAGEPEQSSEQPRARSVPRLLQCRTGRIDHTRAGTIRPMHLPPPHQSD